MQSHVKFDEDIFVLHFIGLLNLFDLNSQVKFSDVHGRTNFVEKFLV